jgi:hypothetical protein
MKGRASNPALLVALLLAVHTACAGAPKPSPDQVFGVIGHSFANRGGEAQLEQSLAKTRNPSLAFVVATGVKGAAEPCSDALYTRRRDLFEAAQPPVVVMPAASDWAECKNEAGRRIGIERLNRLRELLYSEPGAQGTHAPVLARQSANAKFRSYAENAYWIAGNVLYATVNIPSNNNHYRPEAGRNSEFEDRAVANRFWINRLFGLARRKKLDALVLFSEGNVKILSEEPGLLARLGRSPAMQDGFAAPRRQIVSLAAQFNGKVLLIDTGAVANGSEPAIAWRGNLGHVSIGSRAVHVHVTPKAEPLFRLEQP